MPWECTDRVLGKQNWGVWGVSWKHQFECVPGKRSTGKALAEISARGCSRKSLGLLQCFVQAREMMQPKAR